MSLSHGTVFGNPQLLFQLGTAEMCFLPVTPTQSEIPVPQGLISPSFLPGARKTPAEMQKLPVTNGTEERWLPVSTGSPTPAARALPARTHAVLQWDVGAQPDVIEGELS